MAQDTRNVENQERNSGAMLRVDTGRITPSNNGPASSVAGGGVGIPSGSGDGGFGVNGGGSPDGELPGGISPAGGAGQPSGLAQDSLSLLQLKRLVGEGGRTVQPEYAFNYATSDTLVAELSEWFSYSTAELSLLVTTPKSTFESNYITLSLPPHQSAPPANKVTRWTTSKDVKRRRYISRCLDLMDQSNQQERVKGLEGLSYVAQGVFGELHDQREQLAWIKRNSILLRKASVAEGVFNCIRKALGLEWEFAQQLSAAPNGTADSVNSDENLSQRAWNRRELREAMTVIYFLIEVTRLVSEEETDLKDIGLDEELESFRDEIAQLPGEGGLLGYLVRNIARVRWEDNADVPLTALLLLTWKTALLLFGSPDKHLPKVKEFARVAQGLSLEVDKTQITANPLDYYLFRQDLIAKYPAYNPPKPMFSFDSNSYLPSMGGHESSLRPGGNIEVLLGGKGGGETLASILDKAVHIATPAPSPPPSPVNIGKGQKKQNYQTNQNFPFLYPPANEDGDSKCWWRDDDGGGVPKSIQEAGELFSSRTRASLAMKHLWQEKEAFEKYGRGWQIEPPDPPQRKWDIEDRIPRWEEKRLAAVDEVYQAILPELQSLVFVLFKVILQTISSPPQNFVPPPLVPQNTFADEENRDVNDSRQVISDPAPGAVDSAPSVALRNTWAMFGRRKNPETSALGTIGEDAPDPADLEKQRERDRVKREAAEIKRWEDTDTFRTREITSKAISALFLVVLKWFRVSHTLKFEYFTQLLLDSNYIPLVLKLFNQADIPGALTEKTDRPERNYFHVCSLHSLSPPPVESPTELSSPDSACPPPIARTRSPQDPLPPTPDSPPQIITDFSWRNFFTYINILRILQKVVKGKAHRNLALVQYKSSQILRKALKAPQTELRLYTLKVFKGQVPYCARKWRQNNMRVITAIYLHCRPELRDDWLSGGDIESEVDEAPVQEQALRALTTFYNVRYFPKAMGADQTLLQEEMDFFKRELEKMEVFSEGELVDEGAVGGVGGEWGEWS